ncbi:MULTISPECIES: SDR family NAD(P)-dependent oxidoreductase [Raoultella]|jgi:NAD(P)-dependent dehydrogenase (short-subunit alcohol dehydrogenase family)|uniref:SDR family NAD(P)-dependent oxidoreductase n=1 Tax=Raoultella TaxID=160674 RepID=UPI0021692FB2|nr:MULTISPECIES: SDR family oxidoreductase [Raoultella]MCS4269835.1 NAD(P)-dependent dehydrogenase (short-subunit alcohol dehydrogenase family) [Raoultella sp. BIGb0132]MCS4286795.1 NAD(P)-dependent dehydrogenase (short-subunit alcohol dehydrogenase family) [Raoultella terrigena]
MTLPKTPSFRLDGKRALVTGGSRGIGFAAGLALAEAGAEVWIAARDRAQLEAAVDAAGEAGLTLSPLVVDITQSAEVERAIERLPALDILVNSAGLARHQPFTDVSRENYDAVMDINVRATFFVSQQVVRRMIDAGIQGSIVHISSQMGHVGGPMRSVYCASKFALEGMTRAMAIELGPSGIRVNTLCPTFIATELSRTSLADPTFHQQVLSNIKLGRLGQLEDVMGPVVFLASPAAALITGTALLVDGGWTAS